MELKRCGTCKFWDSVDRSWDGCDRRICLAVPHPSDLRDEPERNPLAIVADTEQYSAYLLTLAEFGCILHEEKA